MQNAKLKCSIFLNFKFLILNSPSLNPIPGTSGKRGMAGFTLIEVIVAIAILAISLVMIMQLFSGGLRVSRTSRDYTRAIVYAKDKMEELHIEPVQGSGEFEDGFKWESEVYPFDEYEEKLENTDINLLKIKVKVIWSNIANQQKSVELISLKTIEKEK